MFFTQFDESMSAVALDNEFRNIVFGCYQLLNANDKTFEKLADKMEGMLAQLFLDMPSEVPEINGETMAAYHENTIALSSPENMNDIVSAWNETKEVDFTIKPQVRNIIYLCFKIVPEQKQNFSSIETILSLLLTKTISHYKEVGTIFL